MPLDLVVPDLLPPEDAPAVMRELRLPWVERWVARADRRRLPFKGANAWLGHAFGISGALPVAAVTALADDLPNANWLRADPVHLRVSGDGLTLHDSSVLGIEAAEARSLVAALQAHFAADGITLHAPVPDRWYARLPAAETPRTTPLENAIGRDVYGLLPRGTGELNWPSAITEAQMVLSASDVNVLREAAGKPPVNSVWFWGEGALPASVESSYALVYAREPFAKGLARLAGVRSPELPARWDAIDAVRAEEWVLVVDDRLTQAVRAGDEAAWAAAANTLDEGWFSHLGEMAERFDGVRLVLPGPRDTLVADLPPNARWRWFRTRKPLAHHA